MNQEKSQTKNLKTQSLSQILSKSPKSIRLKGIEVTSQKIQ